MKKTLIIIESEKITINKNKETTFITYQVDNKDILSLEVGEFLSEDEIKELALFVLNSSIDNKVSRFINLLIIKIDTNKSITKHKDLKTLSDEDFNLLLLKYKN